MYYTILQKYDIIFGIKWEIKLPWLGKSLCISTGLGDIFSVWSKLSLETFLLFPNMPRTISSQLNQNFDSRGLQKLYKGGVIFVFLSCPGVFSQ